MLAALALVLGLAPAPAHYVTDGPGWLSDGARVRLERRLAGYDAATCHVVDLWIGDSTPDHWRFGLEHFNSWTVGRRGYNDGVVLWVWRDDAPRHCQITVGSGLMDTLTDAESARICRALSARIRAGEVDAGVGAALEEIMGLATASRTPQCGRQ